MARRRPGAVAGTVVTFVVAGSLAVGAVVAGLTLLEEEPPAVVRCSAAVDGTPWHLATDQAETAALLSAQTVRRGMPARAATIAIATGLQESKLRNITYGDRDSIGIFQQRPSQGWGTPEQIMDPVYATTAFLDALARVDGYEHMEVTVAAQTVQRSGFPDAYAQHEPRSRAWASALTGHSPASLTCALPGPTAPGDPEAFVARTQRDFSGLVPAVVEGQDVVLEASTIAGDPERGAWAVAQWAVALAEPLGVVEVHRGDHVWRRGDSAWVDAREPSRGTQVRVRLAGPDD